MDLNGKKTLVIGGAGFIGGFVVAELLKHPVKEVTIYDNFTRGKMENIDTSLKDDRCSIYPFGGDVREVDILDKAVEGMDYVLTRKGKTPNSPVGDLRIFCNIL